jgi:hypothetical protein
LEKVRPKQIAMASGKTENLMISNHLKRVYILHLAVRIVIEFLCIYILYRLAAIKNGYDRHDYFLKNPQAMIGRNETTRTVSKTYGNENLCLDLHFPLQDYTK